jgi:hypothetical protein
MLAIEGADNHINEESEMANNQGAPDENSTFSRLMNTRVAQVNRTPNGRVVALLVFDARTTVADVNDAIRQMGNIVETSNVQEFQPEYGMPVIWYP